MTAYKTKWPIPLVIVAGISMYLHAHPSVPPKPQPVTLAQGTELEVRLEKPLSSKTSTPGERVSAKLAKPLSVNSRIVVPEGTELSVKVIEATPVGHLAGGASLKVALTSFAFEGKEYAVHTNPVVRVSQGQGKRTAKLAGGGAAVGAAIGALVHGGKGALIGAAIGAGGGAVGSAATNSAHDVAISKESALTFRLTQPLVVTPKPAPQPAQTDLLTSIRALFS